MTFIRLEKGVSREPKNCSWCVYPIEVLDALYTPMVDRRALGAHFCSYRCAVFAARHHGWGDLEIRCA